MDAFENWKQHHEEVKELFKQAEEAEGKEQKEIFKQIKRALETRGRIEETIFFPIMEEPEQLKDIALESAEDKQITTLLCELEDLVFKLKALKNEIEHHADEEVEGMYTGARDYERDSDRIIGGKLSKQLI